MPRFETIAKVEEIQAGKMKRYQCPFADILIANVEGAYYAVSNTCSHANELLSNGMLVGKQVVCSAHFAVFNLETGAVLRHPEGAAIDPIKTFQVKVENGEISVGFEE